MERVTINEQHIYDYGWQELGNERLSEEDRVWIANGLLREIWLDKSLHDIGLFLSMENLPSEVVDRAEAMKKQLEIYYEVVEAFGKGDVRTLTRIMTKESLCEEVSRVVKSCIKALGESNTLAKPKRGESRIRVKKITH